MEMFKTQCCAITEIGLLSEHRDPKEALVSFCARNLTAPVKFGIYRGMAGAISSYYLFTARVEFGTTVSYGSKFADLIERLKLGSVWASPITPNKAFHPSHANQIWVWTPDLDKLKAWYEKYKNSLPDEKS